MLLLLEHHFRDGENIGDQLLDAAARRLFDAVQELTMGFPQLVDLLHSVKHVIFQHFYLIRILRQVLALFGIGPSELIPPLTQNAQSLARAADELVDQLQLLSLSLDGHQAILVGAVLLD